MIDAYSAVTTVYALVDLQQRALHPRELLQYHKADELVHCRRELATALNKEARLLASAFYDYIVTACAGEAWHAQGHSQVYWTNFPVGGERHDAWREAQQYNPDSLLAHLQTLFASRWIDGSYGGKAWCKIATAGMLYRTTSPLIFLDHVVDLSHNGGLFLDKGVIFDGDLCAYLDMLAIKANGDLLNTNNWLSINIHDSVWNCVQETTRLLGVYSSRLQKVHDPDWNEEKIEWDTQTFVPKAIDRGDDWYSDEDNNESEDEDSEESEGDEDAFEIKPARIPVHA